MTRATPAVSVSPFAAEMIAGPARVGTAVGAGYVLFGDRVLSVTRPGALRMPNGIEADVPLSPGERVSVGGGALRTAAAAITSGPLWDPRPRPRVRLSVRPRLHVVLETLAGQGPGLTPLGDDVLVGYLAAAALAGWDPAVTGALAVKAGRRTTALSSTLLWLAAQGHLPEAAHHLLERGDPGPLLRFGASSGTGIALGLALFPSTLTGEDRDRPRAIVLTLPLERPAARFELVIVGLAGRQ